MSALDRVRTRDWAASDLLIGLLFVAGVGLVSTGSYLHFTIAARVQAGQCDGCAPWHPLFVLAPIAVGAAFLLLARYLLYRR